MGCKTTWRAELKTTFHKTGDDYSQMICTLSDAELDEVFDSSYGSDEGHSFTAWGPTYVYFPVCHAGAEWVGHAPRNPCPWHTPHQGGGGA